MNVANYLKRLGVETDKFGFGRQGSLDGEGAREQASSEHDVRLAETASSLSKILAGAPGTVDEAYFPPDVIAGSCPRVPGEEEEIVWNAAAEACDSERVHVVWQSSENKIWYLAVRSTELASHASSWCPFAALLPGMKDAMPSPICYTYYGDEMATMMAVSADGVQLYRGTNFIVRAKAERTSREMGNAAIVELVLDRIQALTPIPWYSLSLFEDRARRILATVTVAVALSLALFAFLVWLLASMSLIAAQHNLSEALARTQDKTLQLVSDAQKLRTSPLREQIAKFTELNDGLLDLNGFLDVYEIKGGKTRWRALVPSNVTADRINGLNGKTIDTKVDGTVIGNAAEIEYEALNVNKK